MQQRESVVGAGGRSFASAVGGDRLSQAVSVQDVSVEVSLSTPGGGPTVRNSLDTGRSGGTLPEINPRASGGKPGPSPGGLTRKNLTVSAATHSALVQEKRAIEARERELQLTRKNRAEADPLLMESWLNDALTTKDAGGGAAADEPPLDMLQQGAAGLHGLQNHGLTRAELKRRGLSPKAIERIYRSMYVYTVGFHDILKELFSHCDDKAELVTSVWSG